MASTSTRLGLDVGVVLRDALEDLVPQHHAVLLGVALGDAGDLLPGPGPGELEGEPDDPLAADLGEHRGLGGDLAGSARPPKLRPPKPAYSPSVFSRTTTQSRSVSSALRSGLVMPGRNCDRAHVGPLVEALADAQAQPPQADVVGDVRPADGAEVDGVEVLELLEPVLGHHPAGLLVVLAAPRELLPLEVEAPVASSRRGRRGPGGRRPPPRGRRRRRESMRCGTRGRALGHGRSTSSGS